MNLIEAVRAAGSVAFAIVAPIAIWKAMTALERFFVARAEYFERLADDLDAASEPAEGTGA